MRSTLRSPVVFALALYAVTALIVTWPLVGSLGTKLPLGQLPNATVPWFNLWTLEWNADRLVHGFADYFRAPIFHPARRAFALSEPQGLTGLVFAPLAWLGGPVAGYNLTLLIALALNGIAMRRWLRILALPEAVATAAGVLAVALPFALKELGVLQLCVLSPPLLVLAEVCSLFQAPSRAALLRAALFFACTLWTCIYYALFLALLLVPAVPWLLRQREFRQLLDPRVLVLACLLVVVPAAPLWIAQRAAVGAYHREPATIKAGSASGFAYSRPLPGSLVKRALGDAGEPKRALYPGVVLVALAGFGIFSDRRGRRRRALSYCLVAGVLALLVSFGTRLRFGDFSPYAAWIQGYVPGFSQLRSPYRMAAFVHALLVVFAAFGLDALRAVRLSSSGRALPSALGPALVALALLEVVPLGAALEAFPIQALHEPWVEWLAQHPGGAVAMVPPALTHDASAYEPTTLAMLQGLRHGHPLVNGYSGFFPPAADRRTEQLLHFPRPACLQVLRRVGVRYAVVDEAWMARQTIDPAWRSQLERVFTGSRSIYLLKPERL